MAHKRFTDTNIWDKDWFMELKPKHKCLIKYLFDKCDACGAWKPNWKLASLHIGEPIDVNDLDHIPTHQYEILDNGKIFLPDFINFQYVTLSKKSPAHNPVFMALEKNTLLHRLVEGVFTTPKDKDMDKDKVKEEEKEKEKDFGKSENLLNGENFLIPQMLQLWVAAFPTYTTDKTFDYPALKTIAGFIFKNSATKETFGSQDSEIKCLNTFQLIADQVNREPFWVNKPLSSISNKIQEFYNKIKNPINGHAKSNHASSAVTTREQINKLHSERFGNGR